VDGQDMVVKEQQSEGIRKIFLLRPFVNVLSAMTCFFSRPVVERKPRYHAAPYPVDNLFFSGKSP